MKTDEEIGKTFKIEVKENNLIFIEFYEALTEESDNARQADIVVDTLIKLSQKNKGELFNFLIDLTAVGNATYMSAHAKERYRQLPNYYMFRKAAVIGRSLFLEVTVNLLMSAAGRGESLKWFSTKVDALKWLNLQ